MTDKVGGKRSLVAGVREDFKALSTKQIVAIIIAIALSLILEVLGFGSICIGFLIIAVVLYMIPHFMKVTSVGVKAVIGVVFVVLSVLIGTLAYTGTVEQTNSLIDQETSSIQDLDVYYNEEDGHYYLDFQVSVTSIESDSWSVEDGWQVLIQYGDITRISFGGVGSPSVINSIWMSVDELTDLGNGWYSGTAQLTEMTDGKYEYIALGTVTDEETPTVLASLGFTYDSGLSSGDIYMFCFYGSGYSTLLVALMFFIILAFSALMRRSAYKTREKMEAEGRLYPQGYGRCKECGAMVLPGEVVCRKCGAYIEVPEELKVQKKDYVVCSECGAEVPADATVCPKCGAAFDEAEEVRVDHADGTVEISSDTVPCPHCGEQIPSGATWCPKCGKKVKERS